MLLISEPQDETSKPRWYHVLASVLAAMMGVQSKKNHSRDFNQKSPWAYVAWGLFFALVFVLSIYFVVQLVLSGVK